MPHFKKVKFTAKNAAGHIEELTVDVSINTNGHFYAHLPDVFEAGLKGTFAVVKGKVKVIAKTYEELSRLIEDALNQLIEVKVTNEHVIRFNINSDVSFAEDGEGNIFPNAGFPGANWPYEKSGMFGSHHSSNPSVLGYSLTIGARAMTKTTYRFGDKEKVDYVNYYKEGSHHGHENPANLLNSWCSFTLGSSPREIPYSDESALFFHNLMMAMAELSKRIQEATFNEQALLGTIANQGLALLGNSAGKNATSE